MTGANMKHALEIASAVALLALASGHASAQQVYAGQTESIRDTTAPTGCGETLATHQYFRYRQGTPSLPAAIFIGAPGIDIFIQPASGQDFDFTGAQGSIKGTVTFAGNGPPAFGPGFVQTQTLGASSYTFPADFTDPDMITITGARINLRLKESGMKCSFIWNGVMTPALMPSG